MHYQQNGQQPHWQYNPQQQNVYIMPHHRKPKIHWTWHLALTMVTGGMWGFVWLWLIATGKR